MKAPPLAKLTRPKTAGLLKRHRLFHLLDQFRASSSMIWVAAQPGAGKTSLVSSYLDAQKLTGIWYQCDEGDQDLASFFFYMGVATSQATPRKKPFSMLLTPDYLPSLSGFVRRYFRAIAERLPKPFVIVLDNYQDGATPALNSVLGIAGEELPEGCLLILISRASPPGEFARHLANQALSCVNAEDLLLTIEETRALLPNEGDASDEVLHTIQSQTDGWAAGVVLMREHGRRLPASAVRFSTTPESVFDYFAGQIIDKLPADTREFLLRTSFLPRFTVAMAATISGNENADQTLEYMHRHHLFTNRRDGELPVFEFHALFRCFLIERARVRFPSPEKERLLQTAASLLRQADQLEDSIALYSEAKDFVSVADLAELSASEIVARGRGATLIKWLAPVPRQVVDEKPWLSYWLGMGLIPNKPSVARISLEVAFFKFREKGDKVAQVVTIAAILQSYYYEYTEFRAVDTWLELIEPLLTSPLDFENEQLELRAYAGTLAAALFRRPDSVLLPVCAAKISVLLEAPLDLNQRCSAATFLLNYYVWAGKWQQVRELATAIIGFLQLPEIAPLNQIFARSRLGYCYLHLGDHKQAEALLNEAWDMAMRESLHSADSHILFFQVLTKLSVRDVTAAREKSARLSALASPTNPMASGYANLAECALATYDSNRIKALESARSVLQLVDRLGVPYLQCLWSLHCLEALLLVNAVEEAGQLLIKVRSITKEGFLTFYDCEFDLAEAYLYRAQGNMPDAMVALSRALEKAERVNSSFLFRYLPRLLPDLLEEALSAGIKESYVREVINALNIEAPNRTLELWPWAIKIYTFGEFRVMLFDKPVGFGRKVPRKPLALLKAMVALGGRDIPVQKLIDSLWTEGSGENVQDAFDVALHRLRKLLGHGDAVQLVERKLSLNETLFWTDVGSFEIVFDQAQVMTNTVNGSQIDYLERAVRVYRGTFLPADTEESWTVSTRERLRNRFIRATATLGQHYERLGQRNQAIICYQRGVDADDLAEPLYQGLMRCLGAEGRRAEAITVFRRLRQNLSVVLGVKPSAATEQLVLEINVGP